MAPDKNREKKPVGYLYLTEKHNLNLIKNWHLSYTWSSSEHLVENKSDQVCEIFPRRMNPESTEFAHLEFAVKYDGYNLEILTEIFKVIDVNEFVSFIKEKKTSPTRRRLWFLYEWSTGTRLPIDDLTTQSYIPVLNPEEYFTLENPKRVTRQRVLDNLLGTVHFCPTVRKTDLLKDIPSYKFQHKFKSILDNYEEDVRSRAMSYLYLRETKSSYLIEHETPNPSKTARFVNLLSLADVKDFCNKDSLIDLQKRIVDPRFAIDDYRTNQNYVGSTSIVGGEIIHYISPRPEDLPELMDGLIESHRRMLAGNVHSIAHAAAIAWGFVFLHPFEDGNGRTHRFLIHNIFAMSGLTPSGFILPVSATMFNNMGLYNQSLEQFSVPLVRLIDFDLDDDGKMTVNNETKRFYRYIDFTTQAETLLSFIDKTVETELVIELDYLKRYDKTKQALQEIVDLPGQKLELLIRSLSGNKGKLGDIRRRKNFDFLTDDEVVQLESSFQENWGESFDAPDDSLNR